LLRLEEPVPNIAAHMLLGNRFFELCGNFTEDLKESHFNPVGKSHIAYTFTPHCLRTTIIIHSPSHSQLGVKPHKAVSLV